MSDRALLHVTGKRLAFIGARGPDLSHLQGRIELASLQSFPRPDILERSPPCQAHTIPLAGDPPAGGAR